MVTSVSSAHGLHMATSVSSAHGLHMATSVSSAHGLSKAGNSLKGYHLGNNIRVALIKSLVSTLGLPNPQRCSWGGFCKHWL